MERTRTFSAFFKLIFEFIRKHSVSSRTPSQKNNDKMAIKMHIHSLLNHFVRGAESAGKMIKFAQTGKFFRKLPHLGEQQNTSLRRDTLKISPETENFPNARLHTRVDSAPLYEPHLDSRRSAAPALAHDNLDIVYATLGQHNLSFARQSQAFFHTIQISSSRACWV